MKFKSNLLLAIVVAISGCQTTPLSLTKDVEVPVAPAKGLPSANSALPESELEGLRQPRQSNHRFEMAFAGNFPGGAEFISTASPLEYIDYLWGSKNRHPKGGLEVARKNNWRDQIKFYTLNGSRALPLSTNITNPEDMCLHAAHVVVANFNDDAYDDAVIACHGYDAQPFPGDHSYILLSNLDGSYSVQQLTEEVGFYHGASTLDLNSDGLSDIVLTDASSGTLLGYLNQGNGNFSQGQVVLRGLRSNYTVSAANLNNDRYADLIVGGHEEGEGSNNMPTTVFWNDGFGNFSNNNKTTLPPVPGYGIVLDYIQHSPYLFIVRTQSGRNFYQGGAIQQIDLENFSQVDLIKRPKVRHPAKLQRVYSPSGKTVYGSLDCDRNSLDFIVSPEGALSLVREIEQERLPSGCLSVTP